MWTMVAVALAACPELVPRQAVGSDPTWLEGDVPTVWADGRLWWLAADGLRSTASPAGKGRPVGRRGQEVLWGTLRDDMGTWDVPGVGFAIRDWYATHDGALAVGIVGKRPPSVWRLATTGAPVKIGMPPASADGLPPMMQEACRHALPTDILEDAPPRVLATGCTLPGEAWLVGPDAVAEALPVLESSVALVAGADRLAAVFVDESAGWPAHQLAWREATGWTGTELPADRVLDLVVADGQRVTIATHEGRYRLRCEADDIAVAGGEAAFGAHPLSVTPAWGLATLVQIDGAWWIASTQAPGG